MYVCIHIHIYIYTYIAWPPSRTGSPARASPSRGPTPVCSAAPPALFRPMRFHPSPSLPSPSLPSPCLPDPSPPSLPAPYPSFVSAGDSQAKPLRTKDSIGTSSR